MKMRHVLRLTGIAAFLAGALFGCAQLQPDSAVSLFSRTPTRVATALVTATLSPSSVASPPAQASRTPDLSPVPHPLTQLPAGSYVVFSETTGLDERNFPIGEFFAVSVPGGRKYALETVDRGRAVPSPHGTLLVLSEFVGTSFERTKITILDLVTGQSHELNNNNECVAYSWSQDEQYLVGLCGGESRLAFIPVDGAAIIEISLWEDLEAGWISPDWSPDGDRIAVQMATASMEPDPRDGLYLLPSWCPVRPDDCIDAIQHMPNAPFGSPTVWSPDGKKLAIGLTRDIVLYGISQGDEGLIELPDYGGITSLAWSDDGEWIAYVYPRSEQSPYLDIFMSSVSSGEVVQITHSTADEELAFWWRVPGR